MINKPTLLLIHPLFSVMQLLGNNVSDNYFNAHMFIYARVRYYGIIMCVMLLDGVGGKHMIINSLIHLCLPS